MLPDPAEASTTRAPAATQRGRRRTRGSIRSRVPFDEYAALPGISITRLKELKRSPLHYRHILTQPKTSPSLTLGTAAHVATLEPERFDRQFAVWSRRTDSGRLAPRTGQHWDAFVLEHAGQTILSEDECSTARAIAKAVRSDPAAMRYLDSGEPEVTMQWRTQRRDCKGRVDWIVHLDAPVLVGLKTTRDCRLFAFGSQAAKLDYALQWAWYFNGYTAINGAKHRPRVVEIVVESAPPHAVAVYRITDDILLQGEEEYMRLLERLKECNKRRRWPGPYDAERVLTLPSWYYGDSGDDLSDLGLE